MPDTNKLIDKIIFAFDMEMGTVERHKVMAEIASGNAPNLMDAFNRQRRKGRDYDEQRAALRRVLRRLLPTDTTPPDTEKMKEQLRPAAEQALQEAAKTIERQFNQ